MSSIKRRQFLTAGVLAAASAAPVFDAESAATPSSPAAPATNASKKKLWMLLAPANDPHVHLVAPTIAWIADQAGVTFENYFEAHGNGDLFGSSTVVGGHHHQQFDYLNTLFDVDYILLGSVRVFRSSKRCTTRGRRPGVLSSTTSRRMDSWSVGRPRERC